MVGGFLCDNTFVDPAISATFPKTFIAVYVVNNLVGSVFVGGSSGFSSAYFMFKSGIQVEKLLVPYQVQEVLAIFVIVEVWYLVNRCG